MKTTDLIPLILLELNDSDKYGFELTKSIESKSQGKIVIKQPTLYTILKKLEKSKFISSYWQDSDIGGKRHYYKITGNGRMQVSTLPSFSVLIANIMSDGQDITTETKVEESVDKEVIASHDQTPSTPSQKEETKSFSIMDMINEEPREEKEEIKEEVIENNLDITYTETNENITLIPEIKESVIPTSEVFSEDKLDILTDNEINESNLDVVKSQTKSEKFVSNDNVSSFTKKQPELSKEYKEEIHTKSLESFIIKEDPKQTEEFNYQNVKYVDYVNFATDKKHIKAKNITNKLTLSVCMTTLYMLLMVLLSTLCVKFSGTSPLFYVAIIISCVALIFYPSLFFAEKEKIRLKLLKENYKPDFKKQIIIAIAIEFVVLLTCIIVNAVIGNQNILDMFAFNNFENIYAQILISSTLFIDILFKYLLTKKFINLE
ncbi:MAG: helix-turn-helix transcriptional regulator [Clostridia bacterium]|nr:helix-turn-helix transcriptional regulator [Clostridia bacterium]